MASGQLSNYWRQAGDTLGFAVESPHEVFLPSGHRLTFPVRLPDFGAEHGMLLTDHYADFAAHADALAAAGYGYSVLSVPNGAPGAAEIVETLKDWGWSGSGAPPGWLLEACHGRTERPMKLTRLLATDDPAAIDLAAWRTARSAIVELAAAAREYRDQDDDAAYLRLAAALAPFDASAEF